LFSETTAKGVDAFENKKFIMSRGERDGPVCLISMSFFSFFYGIKSMVKNQQKKDIGNWKPE
jgi:hypothetical protein